MQIPLLGRLGRRPVDPTEDADEYGDVIDAVERQSTEPTLLLQRMENRLVRHDLAAPDVLSRNELRRLRYILNFARLTTSSPARRARADSRSW